MFLPGRQIVMPDPQHPDREKIFAVVLGLAGPWARLRRKWPGRTADSGLGRSAQVRQTEYGAAADVVAPQTVQDLAHSCRGEQFGAEGGAVLGAEPNMVGVASLPLPAELSFFVP
ncbi:hypothetical protein GCM10017776_18300 [Streptomyces griseoluteus]|nr:hypothetical protein GCM10017776_18300 [Streptomyces griseoluteus]